GKNGDQTFRVWFVPRDWIGIQPGRMPRREGYWEGVLMDQQYKTLVPAGPFFSYEAQDAVPIYAALRSMRMELTSLVNGGWSASMTVFGGRLDDVDQQAQHLVRQFCNTRVCVDSAAYSLIILGVPARTVTLECAEHAADLPQAYCADELGYWNVSESL